MTNAVAQTIWDQVKEKKMIKEVWLVTSNYDRDTKVEAAFSTEKDARIYISNKNQASGYFSLYQEKVAIDEDGAIYRLIPTYVGLDETPEAKLKRCALAKLTPEERKALGLG